MKYYQSLILFIFRSKVSDSIIVLCFSWPFCLLIGLTIVWCALVCRMHIISWIHVYQTNYFGAAYRYNYLVTP